MHLYAHSIKDLQTVETLCHSGHRKDVFIVDG